MIDMKEKEKNSQKNLRINISINFCGIKTKITV